MVRFQVRAPRSPSQTPIHDHLSKTTFQDHLFPHFPPQQPCVSRQGRRGAGWWPGPVNHVETVPESSFNKQISLPLKISCQCPARTGQTPAEEQQHQVRPRLLFWNAEGSLDLGLGLSMINRPLALEKQITHGLLPVATSLSSFVSFHIYMLSSFSPAARPCHPHTARAFSSGAAPGRQCRFASPPLESLR